jgi:hypothetical protein
MCQVIWPREEFPDPGLVEYKTTTLALAAELRRVRVLKSTRPDLVALHDPDQADPLLAAGRFLP